RVGAGRVPLEPARVVLVVDAGVRAILRPNPSRADDDEDDVAPVEDPLDMGAEIGAGGDLVDVEEHGLGAVTEAQAIIDAAGDGLGIGPAGGRPAIWPV